MIRRLLAFVLILICLVSFSGTSFAITKVDGSDMAGLGGSISEFEYEIDGNKVKLKEYTGTAGILIVQSSYEIDGKKYNTDLTEFSNAIENDSVHSVFISEGIEVIEDAMLNSSEVTRIYVPRSLKIISNRVFTYMHDWDGEELEIYYGGSQKEFESKLTDQTGNPEKDEYAQKGGEWANKFNKWIGGGYDPNDYTFYFDATLEDFIAPYSSEIPSDVSGSDGSQPETLAVETSDADANHSDDALKNENANLVKENEELKSQNANLEAANKELQGSVDALQEQVGALTASIEDLNSQITILQSEKDEAAKRDVISSELAQNIGEGSYEVLFSGMELNDLIPISGSLDKVINAKKLENATLTIDPAEASVAVKKKLSLTLVPDGREIDRSSVVTYTSADENVATVKDGVVVGVGVGETEITASVLFEDGAILEAKAKVEVFTPATAVKVPQTLAVIINTEANISDLVTLTPETATLDRVQYSVSDDTVASVDEKGVIKGLSVGKTVVTVTSEGGDRPVSAKCTVSVNQPVESIALDSTELNVGKKNKVQIAAVVGPEEATDKSVVWTSDDEAIAKVDNKGVVTGISSGETTIHCVANDGSGIEATAKVHVITAVSSITFPVKTVELMEKGKVSIGCEVLPEDATDKSVKWESSDSSIAKVDKDGNVTGVKAGQAVISATAEDGSNKTSSFTAYVEPIVPATPTAIHWQTQWGTKNGRMGVEVENHCLRKSIISVTCYFRFKSAYTGEITETTESFAVSVAPGRKKESELSRQTVSGFSNASQIEVTIVSVEFKDGSVYEIPKNDRVPWLFTM